MSPHAERGTGTCHTVETVERGRERGWEGNCLGNELPEEYHKKNASRMYAMLRSTSMWNSNTCAYVSTPLTTRGTQALFVVKLRLIAFKMGTTRGLKQVITQCRRLTELAHKVHVCADNVSMKSMYPSK